MRTIQYKNYEQALTIESLKLGISGVRTDLNTLIESVNVSRTQMTTTESNIIKHRPILTYNSIKHYFFT